MLVEVRKDIDRRCRGEGGDRGGKELEDKDGGEDRCQCTQCFPDTDIQELNWLSFIAGDRKLESSQRHTLCLDDVATLPLR